MNYRKLIEEEGFVIVKNVFSVNEIHLIKEEIIKFIKNNKTLRNSRGITIPNFIKRDQLKNVSNMKTNKKILDTLQEIFSGNNFRFCQHNDIGINRVVGWHKDKLNGIYDKYETVNIWSEHKGEKHEIVKVLIYLQDHTNNKDGLKLVPKSHFDKDINSNGWIQLNPSIGDVIIFDQRITHRGMENQVKEPRILVSFGFGKNNIFTDNFEKGTVIRQNEQNKLL